MTVKARNGPLSSLSVLELAGDLATAFCAKVLGDLGASVIKVEPTGDGDPRRSPDGPEGPSTAPGFLYANSSKQSIQADISGPAGRNIVRGLLATHDVVIATGPESRLTHIGLGHDSLMALNPRAILVLVSPFGSEGPYRDWQATPLVLNALGGWANTCGLRDQPPLLGGGNLSEFVTGGYAAAAALAAVNQRDVTGAGQRVDVSGQECVLTAALLPTLVWEYAGTIQERNGSRSTGPSWMMKCNDGFVGANVLTPGQWQGLCELVEAWDLLGDPQYARPVDRMAREPELRERFEPWFQARSAAAIFHEAQARRLPFGLVPTFLDILEFEQHREREFFVEFPHPDLADTLYKFPGLPFRFSATPARPHPAPSAGEQTEDILADLLGYSPEHIAELVRDGVVGRGVR